MFYRIYGGVHHHPAALMQNQLEATNPWGGGIYFFLQFFLSFTMSRFKIPPCYFFYGMKLAQSGA